MILFIYVIQIYMKCLYCESYSSIPIYVQIFLEKFMFMDKLQKYMNIFSEFQLVSSNKADSVPELFFSNSGENHLWQHVAVSVLIREFKGLIISDIISYFKRQQLLNKIIIISPKRITKAILSPYYLYLLKLPFTWLSFLFEAVLILPKAIKMYLGVWEM